MPQHLLRFALFDTITPQRSKPLSIFHFRTSLIPLVCIKIPSVDRSRLISIVCPPSRLSNKYSATPKAIEPQDPTHCLVSSFLCAPGFWPGLLLRSLLNRVCALMHLANGQGGFTMICSNATASPAYLATGAPSCAPMPGVNVCTLLSCLVCMPFRNVGSVILSSEVVQGWALLFPVTPSRRSSTTCS